MRKLNKPTENAVEVYRTCISRVRNADLKNRLELIEPEIENAALSFDTAAIEASLYTLPTQNDVGGVAKNEMEKVYTQRMAKEDAPGRFIYEQLLNSAPHNKCPLCCQGNVTTLDHHLPKAHYPSLVVVPVNLVPACADCNKAKLHDIPRCAEEQTLHPYYDNVENEIWLRAEVIRSSPAALRFYVESPGTWDVIKAKRVHYHFKVYRLANLYASNSGSELVNIRHGLKGIFIQEGAVAVRAHIERQAATYEAAHINSWQAAMYRALKACNWFCEGGFQEE